MKKFAYLALVAAVLSSVLSTETASAEAPAVECTSNRSAYVAEGTVIDDEADARDEAFWLAVDAAADFCSNSDAGSPLLIESSTKRSGAVATASVHFVCSETC